jgi:putative nucleotide binding protein
LERAGKKYEELAYVLDYLPHGKPGAARTTFHGSALIQMIGENYFTLLEAVPRRNVTLNIRERIYVGKKDRTKIEHILGRIGYEELTSASKAELQAVIEVIIKLKPSQFIDFFNKSQPVTPRMHSLELLPGIGKRLMWQIIEQREKAQFTDFEDIQTRINISDPVKLLTRRVIEELSQEEKYLLFIRHA